MAQPEGITKITVGGFKSIAQDQSIEIRPLTILAGANSSGKSSMMQPLLLLKQTLEATYDPGALLLDGPNVRFTSVPQLLSRINGKQISDTLRVGLVITDSQGRDSTVTSEFKKHPDLGFDVFQTIYEVYGGKQTLRKDIPTDEIMFHDLSETLKQFLNKSFTGVLVERTRCFLVATVENILVSSDSEFLIACIQKLIHLPGLRGNPERTYPVSAIGPTFPGTFENYTASVIAQWQRNGKNSHKLDDLASDAEKLRLTGKIVAKSISDTQVELQVGRLSGKVSGKDKDLVSIADVGLGVSQTLPVLVALHAAKSGQMVYIEQPELHLHPRAQTAMAQVLADAAMRGVRVVAETHSALLILGLQTLVAEGYIAPELVKLHWFEMQADGATRISSTDIGETGAFTEDRPVDFADVELRAQNRFLDAVEARMMSTH